VPILSILIVLSAADHVTGKDGKPHATGYWAEEFVVPYRALKDAGARITIATPGGRRPTVDPRSYDPSNWKSKEELQAARKLIASAPELKKRRVLASLTDKDLEGFDAVFYPGGHAPMEDLAKDAASGRVLRHFHDRAKPTALVCHGPIALLSAKVGDGWPYRGYRMTIFSDSEERQSHLASVLTYSVEGALKENGGLVRTGKDWQPLVVEDRELLTGQNPMSSRALANALIAKLAARKPAPAP